MEDLFAEANEVIARVRDVLEGKWQPMFRHHFDYLVDCIHDAIREEGIASPKAKMVLEEMKRWLAHSVYQKELCIDWKENKNPRSCM